MKKLIRKILKEELEGLKDSSQEDFEWTEDNNPLDALTDGVKRNKYIMLNKLMSDYGLTRDEALKLIAKHEQPRSRFKHEYDEETTYWTPNNSTSTYQFKYPPKWNSLTRKFTDWVKWNPGGTKREFFKEVLGRSVYNGSHNSLFFSSILDSGIIKMERDGTRFEYSIGPNYETWSKGKLKRYMGMNVPSRFGGD